MRVAISLTILCAILSLALPAVAQQQTEQNKTTRTYQPTKPLSQADARKNLGMDGAETFKYERISKVPTELPNLPNFQPPGGTYKFGLKSVQRGATDVQLYFDSKSDPRSIMQNYTAAFGQPGWKTTYNKNNTVSAVFRGNTCSVRVQPGTGKNASTRVMIDYQFRPDPNQ